MHVANIVITILSARAIWLKILSILDEIFSLLKFCIPIFCPLRGGAVALDNAVMPISDTSELQSVMRGLYILSEKFF
jgi:hypothetical protein